MIHHMHQRKSLAISIFNIIKKIVCILKTENFIECLLYIIWLRLHHEFISIGNNDRYYLKLYRDETDRFCSIDFLLSKGTLSKIAISYIILIIFLVTF